MATDFFQQQDLARRNTKILVLLFTLAVLSLIVLTNLLVMLSFGFFQGQQAMHLPWEIISSISLVVIAVVGLAIMAKWQQLKLGGRTVAQALGGGLGDGHQRLSRGLVSHIGKENARCSVEQRASRS